MKDCAQTIADGGAVEDSIAATKADILAAGFDSIDYLNLANSQSLEIISKHPFAKPARLLIVARCKGIRLLDNCAVG